MYPRSQKRKKKPSPVKEKKTQRIFFSPHPNDVFEYPREQDYDSDDDSDEYGDDEDEDNDENENENENDNDNDEVIEKDVDGEVIEKAQYPLGLLF